MLLYWETLKASCLEGFKFFDFGRSSRNSGTYKFKRQWGAEEQQLYWYTIPLNKKKIKNINNKESSRTILTSMWSKLPLNITCWLGPKIRKYVTL